MEIKNLHSLFVSGVQVVHTIDRNLKITYYTEIIKSIFESPVMVGCRALRDAKHIRKELPTVHQNWRNLALSMKKEFHDLFGSEVKEVRLELWYRVIVVTGSFFCIVGGLGQSLCAPSSRLRIVARSIDLIGLGFLLTEPFVAARLQTKEAMRRRQEGLSDRETVEGSTLIAIRPLSYISRASHNFFFVGRAMHLAEMSAFIDHNKIWKGAYRTLEGIGYFFSFVSWVKSSYTYLDQHISIVTPR